jgi:hypothetical protein
MVQQSPDRLSRGLLAAPLVFVAHFLEESPGFVRWFNAHVTQGITADLFWTVNATGLVITILVCLLSGPPDPRRRCSSVSRGSAS